MNLFEFAFIEDVSREEMGKCMRWLKDQDIRVLAFSKKASKTFQILSSIYKPPRNLLADMLIASIGLAEKKRDGVRSQRAVAQIKFFNMSNPITSLFRIQISTIGKIPINIA